MGRPWLGSAEHKQLLCRVFIDTHEPFDPDEVTWPPLDEQSQQCLATLPIWEEAVRTEAQTAVVVSAMGRAEPDPLLREAISLQGYEEARHARLLELMTARYGIAVPACRPTDPPDPEWAFIRSGYGECFDSFFAFGLFAIARRSGFFPPALVALFEPVMQEEARHIIFHVNWVAYRQARLPAARRPSYLFRRALATWLQIASRLKTAVGLRAASHSQDNFAMSAHGSFSDVSMRGFLEVCLEEHARRLAPYDPRLLRPRFVPALARAALATLPR